MSKNYVIFSKGWDSTQLAKRLQKEGGDVTIGSDTPIEGFKTVPHQKLYEAMEKIENKDEYTIYSDEETSNNLMKQGFNDIMVPKEERDLHLEKIKEEVTTSLKSEYDKKYEGDVKKIKDAIKDALYGTD